LLFVIIYKNRTLFIITNFLTFIQLHFQILPPTQKKSYLSFFAFRISRFCEKAFYFLTSIGQFGLKYFPRFWRHLKKMLINEKVNKKTSFAHFLQILIKKEFVYTFNREAINFQSEVRLFFASEEVYCKYFFVQSVNHLV